MQYVKASAYKPSALYSLDTRDRTPRGHINMRILQHHFWHPSFFRALEPECEILLSMWPFGPLRDP